MSEIRTPRITEVHPAGAWTGEPADRVVLDFDGRYRRRVMLTFASGAQALLDLGTARVLRHGDALVTDAGDLIAVEAAPERLAEIRCRDAGHMLRVAWHLGNRHLPAQIEPDRILIREDRIIVDMVRKLGADVVLIEAPFDPEGGAYGHGMTHGHDHAPGQIHAHDHAGAHGPVTHTHGAGLHDD
jgi:urease accessory protein